MWQSHLCRARTLLAVGQLAAARAAAQTAIQLAPNQAGCWQTLGDIDLTARARPQARTSYVRALRIDPANSDAMNNLAIIDLKSGRIGRAYRGIVAAGRTDSKPLISLNLGRLLVLPIFYLVILQQVGFGLVLDRYQHDPNFGTTGRTATAIICASMITAVLLCAAYAHRRLHIPVFDSARSAFTANPRLAAGAGLVAIANLTGLITPALPAQAAEFAVLAGLVAEWCALGGSVWGTRGRNHDRADSLSPGRRSGHRTGRQR